MKQRSMRSARASRPSRTSRAESAPTLIIHGDKDLLVPIQQAQSFLAKLKEAGVPANCREGRRGARLGRLEKDMPTIVDWFDQHLAKK